MSNGICELGIGRCLIIISYEPILVSQFEVQLKKWLYLSLKINSPKFQIDKEQSPKMNVIILTIRRKVSHENPILPFLSRNSTH